MEQGVTIKREWAPKNLGNLIVTVDLWRAVYPQFRPDVANPAAILDPRVRKAIAYATDKQPLNDVLYEGEGIMAETILAPGVAYYAPAEQAAVKYPYDVRRTEQLLGEAGFQKGSDGQYASPTQGKLSLEIKVNASAQYEKERSLIAASWRTAGLDVQEATLPAAQSQDPVQRATYPSFYAFSTGLGERSLANFARNAIPTPENRWTGTNRQGWTNAEFDRVYDQLGLTLDPNERVQLIGQAVRIISDDVAEISLYYDLGAVAHVSALTGPGGISPDTTGLVAWNVHEWQLK
jgi:peptide/nickel transport system substrate-binding protein